MDAATKETYSIIRRKGDAFDKVCRGVKKITELRKNGKPVIELMFISMAINIHELPDFVVLAKKLGVDRVMVQRFNPHVVVQEVRGWVVDPNMEAVFYRKAKGKAKKLGIELTHTNIKEVESKIEESNSNVWL